MREIIGRQAVMPPRGISPLTGGRVSTYNNGLRRNANGYHQSLISLVDHAVRFVDRAALG